MQNSRHFHSYPLFWSPIWAIKRAKDKPLYKTSHILLSLWHLHFWKQSSQGKNGIIQAICPVPSCCGMPWTFMLKLLESENLSKLSPCPIYKKQYCFLFLSVFLTNRINRSFFTDYRITTMYIMCWWNKITLTYIWNNIYE